MRACWPRSLHGDALRSGGHPREPACEGHPAGKLHVDLGAGVGPLRPDMYNAYSHPLSTTSDFEDVAPNQTAVAEGTRERGLERWAGHRREPDDAVELRIDRLSCNETEAWIRYSLPGHRQEPISFRVGHAAFKLADGQPHRSCEPCNVDTGGCQRIE